MPSVPDPEEIDAASSERNNPGFFSRLGAALGENNAFGYVNYPTETGNYFTDAIAGFDAFLRNRAADLGNAGLTLLNLGPIAYSAVTGESLARSEQAAFAAGVAGGPLLTSILSTRYTIRQFGKVVERVGDVVANNTSIKTGLQKFDPTQISFSQSWVSGQKAGADYNFESLVQSMKANGWQGNPVDVVIMRDGALTSIDNTRILAARQAGIEVQANVRNFDDLITDPVRQSTLTVNGVVPKTWGEATLLRINKPTQNQFFPGWSERFPNGSLYDPDVR